MSGARWALARGPSQHQSFDHLIEFVPSQRDSGRSSRYSKSILQTSGATLIPPPKENHLVARVGWGRCNRGSVRQDRRVIPPTEVLIWLSSFAYQQVEQQLRQRGTMPRRYSTDRPDLRRHTRESSVRRIHLVLARSLPSAALEFASAPAASGSGRATAEDPDPQSRDCIAGPLGPRDEAALSRFRPRRTPRHSGPVITWMARH